MAETSEVQTQTAAQDEPSLLSMLLKDGAVVLAGISIWAAADMWYEATGLLLAQVVAVADAVFVGILIATLAHEWGHYVGTVATGAKTRRFYPNHITFLRFDYLFTENDLKQFHWMTYSGHIMHWLVLLLLLFSLPLDSLPRVTLVSSAFGFVAFATYLEYNIVKDTRAGADPQTRLAALTPHDIKECTVVGTLAGLLAIAVLS